MTGDELAAELYRRQGFLVMGSSSHRNIGEIALGSERANDDVQAPLRIVASATFAEMRSQVALGNQISGTEYVAKNVGFFYRVEID